MKEDLLKIVYHFRLKNQQKKLNEECYELIEAIKNYEYQKEACENIGCKKIHVDKCKECIEEEFADCMVLLEQFKAYYELDNDKIIDKMYEKINRTLERIESGYYDGHKEN